MKLPLRPVSATTIYSGADPPRANSPKKSSSIGGSAHNSQHLRSSRPRFPGGTKISGGGGGRRRRRRTYTGWANLVSQCVTGGAGACARRPLVVGPDGGRAWVEEHTGVAELMIEAPGHVVARVSDVVRERRVRAMAADELLRAGEVYLLVPAGRARAWLGDREVEAIGSLVSGKKKSRKSRPAGGKRVSARLATTRATK